MKGRGALGNPQGRFECCAREPFDDGWPGGAVAPDGSAGPPPSLRTVVRIEPARSVLNRNDSPDLGFDLALNPYRGCEHGCIYCYARPNHAYVDLSPGLDFETRLFARPEVAELLRAELARPSHRCTPIVVGSATDAYQPIEREWRLTRSVLQVFAETRHPVALVTKSSLVERDIDLLGDLAHRGLAQVSVSVTTLDAGLSRRLEPRAAAPWRRLETIRRLAEAGIPVGVSVAPIIPFLNEPEIEHVLEAAAGAGASFAHWALLRLPHELTAMFADWLRTHYPDRARRVLKRLGDMRERGAVRPGSRKVPRRGGDIPANAPAPAGDGGSVRPVNDARFGTRMRGEGIFAQLIRARFEAAAHRYGLDRQRMPLRTDLFIRPERPVRDKARDTVRELAMVQGAARKAPDDRSPNRAHADPADSVEPAAVRQMALF